MRVHHLNCAPMQPPSARFVHGEGGFFDEARLVGHVLAIEGRNGLTLVDSGFGTADVEQPAKRLGRAFVALNRPQLSREHTALAQLERLGFRAADVKHIVLTHLDVDHAGGISDFPRAEIHVHEAELQAALRPKSLYERARYRRAQWAHGPRWATHPTFGERWFGFQAVRALPGDEILLVPLIGHTRGHTAVAVRGEHRWLLHCGDSYFAHAEMHPLAPTCPPGLWLIQTIDDVNRALRVANQTRLRALARFHGDEVELFCAHDARELDRYAASAAPPRAALAG